MSELDVLLSESLGRLAEPGDPTGVADAVRARVGAAGAGGEAPPGAGPTGGGGSAGGSAAGGAGGGFWGGWAPLAVLAGVSLLGGIGLALAQEPDALAADATVPVEISLPKTVPGAACPGGGAVAQLDAGARVLALFRSEDGAFLAVRNPAALPTTVWISADSAELDSGQDVDALPVSDCVEGEAIVAEPSPEPSETAPVPEETTEPAPGPAPKPQPEPQPAPPDQQNPTIQVGNWTLRAAPNNYLQRTDCYFDNSTTITVVASDNVGVTSVTWSTTTAGLSLSGPSISGGNYTFTATYTGNANTTATVKFTAKDAANNSVQANAPTLNLSKECLG